MSYRLTLPLLLILVAHLAGSERAVGAENDVSNAGRNTTPTDAEKIAGIRRLLTTDQTRRRELEKESRSLASEFATLTDQFTELDRRLRSAKSEQRPVDSHLETEWRTARDQLDRWLRRRRTVENQLQTLREKLELEREYVSRLVGKNLDIEGIVPVETPTGGVNLATGSLPSSRNNRAADTAETPTAQVDAPNGSGPSSAQVPASVTTSSTTVPPAIAVESSAPSFSAVPLPFSVVPGASVSSAPAVATAKPVETTESSLEVLDERVVAGRRDRDDKAQALEEAKAELRLFDRSIKVFQEDIRYSSEMLNERTEELSSLMAAKKVAEPADEEATARRLAARQQIQWAIDRERTVIRESTSLLERMRKTRDQVAERVAKAEQALASAQTWLLFLESPISPTRLMSWLTSFAPKALGILLIVFVLRRIANLVEKRIVTNLLSGRRGANANSARAETLGRVFHNVTDSAIVILGCLAILDQAGVNVTVLLGGAAVIGAAIAFGSQRLIQDYFSGFMILIENQYNVGSVISINSKGGLVEDITLRMTALRDEEGILHFIPHSQISTVSNMTYGWSRAVIETLVDYREDVDEVMRILVDLAREMRHDPVYKDAITAEPELQGVDKLGESAVSIKILLKTRAMQQWNVKREFLRRVKNRFDELGINFAFPQQVLHVESANRLAEAATRGQWDENGQERHDQ